MMLKQPEKLLNTRSTIILLGYRRRVNYVRLNGAISRDNDFTTLCSLVQSNKLSQLTKYRFFSSFFFLSDVALFFFFLSFFILFSSTGRAWKREKVIRQGETRETSRPIASFGGDANKTSGKNSFAPRPIFLLFRSSRGSNLRPIGYSITSLSQTIPIKRKARQSGFEFLLFRGLSPGGGET